MPFFRSKWVMSTACLAFACSIQAAPPSVGYFLQLEDTFSGTSLDDQNTWFYREGKAHGGLNQASNVRVSGGSLIVDFKKEQVNGVWEYTCGGVTSRSLFGYGYMEVRSKAWAGSRGLHTSFWTHGLASGWNSEYDSMISSGTAPRDNNCTEIDGYEVDSSDPLYLVPKSSFIIWTNNEYKSGNEEHSVDTSEWNVYGFEWSPGAIKWYYNGELVRTFEDPGFYAPQNLWLTALATPDWYQPPRPTIQDANLPGKSEWDYFRFYTRRHPGANLVGNGGFEFYPEGNPTLDPVHNPKGWIETGTTIASYETKSDSYSGDYMLAHSHTSAYNVTAKQVLEYIPNSIYTFSAWVKSSGGQDTAEIRISGHGGLDVVTTIPATGSWTQVVVDTVEVTTNTVTITITSDADSTEWLHVDDVEFHDIIPLEPAILLDNGDPGYTESGSWSTSSLTGYDGSDTRYSYNTPGAYATWAPTIPEDADYDVYIYKVAHSASDPNAEIQIAYNGGTDTQYHDFSAGSSGWIYLGAFPFASGSPGYVRNTLYTSGKSARADAVIFEKTQIILDNGDVGYSENGNWMNSGLTGWNGSSTRYTNTVGDYAQWSPNFSFERDYDVYFYKVVHTSSDPNARIDIQHKTGTSTLYVDCSTGTSGWVYLGTFTFPAGADSYVRLTQNTVSKYARADAVRFDLGP